MENLHEIEIEAESVTRTPQAREANSLRDLDEVIACAKRGDRHALNRLLTHARPRLYAVALRVMRDRDEAEDVVQESLIKVCRHVTRFEGRSSLTTWLHRIVVNTALDRLRRAPGRGRRAGGGGDEAVDATELAEAMGGDASTPERQYVRAEAGAVVHSALERLSPSHRQALTLRELDGETYQSIADIVQCPVGTIMSRLFHARRRLAEELQAGAAAAV
ncbi:MAG TPA: sigma-70 family RNA polymerase sigma factor [Polyangia bacterium]|nr:sigma-70 family RNA polymerase sigma factor [Polyangia bacterium]